MKILILDIETTGFSPKKNFIVEIGIVELDLSTGNRKIIFDHVMHEKGITKKEVEESWVVENTTITVDEIKAPYFWFMDKAQEDFKRREKLAVQHFVERAVEKQKNFENAFSQEYLLDMQFDADFSIIISTLNEWNKKAKSKSQKETIIKLVGSLFRMSEYKANLKTLSKRAVAEYIEIKKENALLKKQNLENYNTIKSMKSEIEYYGREKESN